MHAFAFGLARELSMLGFVSLKVLDAALHSAAILVLAPLEHALTMSAIVMIAGAFLRYILDDEILAYRYLKIGLGSTFACYLATFWWWPIHVATAVPQTSFHQTWGGWLFHSATCVLIVTAMILVRRKEGWLRTVVSTALLFFFLGEFHVLGSALRGGIYQSVLCPIGHAFHMLAIPLLGYVYIREQTIERQQAEAQLRAYRDHLEDLVSERTLALSESNQQLQKEIVERKHAERALKKLSRKYHLILNSAGEGILLLDKEGNHTFVNPAAAQMLGYETDELIGQHSHRIWHHSREDGTPYPEEECPFYAQFRKGGKLRHGSDQIFWRKDGTSFPVEYVSTPFLSEEGELVGVVGIFRDITERKRAEYEITRRNAELAAQYAIAANISQTLDLDVMLDAVLDTLLPVLDMSVGSIFLPDRDSSTPDLRVRCAGSAKDNHSAKVARDPLLENISERAITTETPIVIDLSSYPAESLPTLIVQEALECLISVPLSAKGKVLGALTLGGRSGNGAVSQQLDLLTGIGQQIGIAIENGYLYRTTEHWVERLSFLHQASACLVSSLDPAEIYCQIVRQAAGLLDCQAYMFRWDTQDQSAVSMSCSHSDRGESEIWRLQPEENLLVASLLRCGHSIAIEDIEHDVEFTDFWRHTFDAKAILSLPVGGTDRLLGFLFLIDQQRVRHWKPAEIELAESFVNHAAIALENAYLHQRVERAAALEERQRIASDMHDGLAQTLSYMGYKIDEVSDYATLGRAQEIVENCCQLRDILDQASKEVRLSITSLQQNPEPPRSFKSCLQDMLAELVVDTDRAVQLDTDLREPFYLAPKRLEQVLRITREALLNALRHAQAEQIVVRVRQDAVNTLVSVVDNGRGFDPVHVQEGEGDHHFGLRIMRARAARIGGTLRIASEPGQGTCVTLSFVTETAVSRRFDVARETTSLWIHPEEDSVYERI